MELDQRPLQSMKQESENFFFAQGEAGGNALQIEWALRMFGEKVRTERGASIRSHKEAESDAKEDVFHKGGGECGGVGVVDVDDDGEGGEVAHGSEEVGGTTVGLDVARLPNVDVDDSKRGGDWPGVDEFAVFANGGVGEDAFGAGFDPFFDVGSEFVPVEPKSDAVEGFVLHEVAGGGGCVEGGEEAVAEGGWGDDKE